MSLLFVAVVAVALQFALVGCIVWLEWYARRHPKQREPFVPPPPKPWAEVREMLLKQERPNREKRK